MIRAAAKNHAHVAVCTDADDVDAVHDAAIANYFADKLADPAPAYRAQGGALKQALRYGENPHQVAAFYSDGSDRPGVD